MIAYLLPDLVRSSRVSTMPFRRSCGHLLEEEDYCYMVQNSPWPPCRVEPMQRQSKGLELGQRGKRMELCARAGYKNQHWWEF